MPRTQRAIRRRSKRAVAKRTTSNDLYRLSGSLGYSNGNGNSSSSNGNDETIENTQPVRRASLSPPEPTANIHKVQADVSEESSDGWSDDENEMSGDVCFAPPRGDEDENADQSSSDSQYSASSSSQSLSNSDDSGDSDSVGDDNAGSLDNDGDGHRDYEYGDTFEPKFGQTDFDSPPPSNDQEPSGFGAGFGDDDMFGMEDPNDYNSRSGYNSSGEGFPETEMDHQGGFDSGFPDEDEGNDYVGSSSDEESGQEDGFDSIPMVISSTSDDEHPQDNGLEEDDFVDPTRNYDSRYDGALADVVEGDVDYENDFDHDAYDAGNAMYGSGSGLGYITHADNSSRSQPDPLLKPFVGERPPTPPSPCASETSLKSTRSSRSSRSTRSAKSSRARSVKLSGVAADEQDDQFDCQTFLAPPSIDLGSNPDFNNHEIKENDLTVPYAEEEMKFQDHSQLQQNMYGDQFDPYDGQADEYRQEGDSQFLPVERDQYDGEEQSQGDDQYNYPSNTTYEHQMEQPLSNEPRYHAEPSLAHDASKTVPPESADALSDLENVHRRDQKIIRLLVIGLCCALFSFAMVLGGAITAAILRRSNSSAEITNPSNLRPQGAPLSPTVGERTPTLRPSLRPTPTKVTLTRAPTTSPTRRPTPKPSVSPTPAPQSETPTPAPTAQPTPGTNNVAGTGGFGSGFGNSNSFGSVTVP